MVSEVKKRPSSADNSTLDDEHPQPKRTKTGAAQNTTPYTGSRAKTPAKVDSNGDKYWEISKARRVTVSTFRGKTMVNIREYYEKDGQELPGKKGISLPLDQFASLVTLLPDIDFVLKEQGHSIPRPEYTGCDNTQREYGGSNDDEKSTGSTKKNIEATSDEEEDED